MDTASTLLGLGLLFLFMAPVGYLLFDQSLKEKQRTKRLAFVSSQLGLNLSEKDFLKDFSIGIDETSGKLLILSMNKKQKPQVIDLRKADKIELVRNDEEGKFTNVLDDVREILLVLRESGKTSHNIIFYTEEDHPVTEKGLRLQNAQKWQKIVSAQKRK